MLVGFDGRHVTRVDRGENRGRTLENHHVVRGLERLARWSGGPLERRIDVSTLAGDGGCAAILQRPGPGPVAAAALVRF